MSTIDGSTQIRTGSLTTTQLSSTAGITDGQLANSNTYLQRLSLTNGSMGPHFLGQAVYLSGAGAVQLAQANDPGTWNVFAVAALPMIASGTVGLYQTWGILTGLTGLTANTTYYLDPNTPGAITPTPPSTTGQYLVEVGLALTASTLFLRPRLVVVL